MSVERLLGAVLAAATTLLIQGELRAQAPGPATEATAGVGEEAATPWGWLKMPKFTMPKIEMPKMPADPLAPLKNSARKVGDGIKKAGEGTKELFTGGAKDPQTSPRTPDDSPSLWERMFGKKEEPKEGAETIGEFMAQKRPE